MEKKTIRRQKSGSPKPQAPVTEIVTEKPMSIYEPASFADHSEDTGTFMNAFRRFAFRSKARLYLLLLVAIIGAWVLSMRDPGPTSTSAWLRQYFTRFQSSDPSARYTVGGSAIPDSQIVGAYTVLSSLGPSNSLPEFQREQFETDLLLFAALESGRLESTEAKIFLETVLRRAAAEYFLLSQMPEGLRHFPVEISEKEIQAVYNKNSDRYARAGIDKALAIQSIRNALITERISNRDALIRVERSALTRKIQERTGATYRE